MPAKARHPRWSRSAPTCPGRRWRTVVYCPRAIQPFGCPTMRSHAVPAVKLSFGWAEGNTIAGLYCIHLLFLKKLCCFCRSCGRIFCADCSENSTPLPSEHLYNPVRVCTTCYTKLRRDCGEVPPDHCKQHSGNQATNNNPQIAASSN